MFSFYFLVPFRSEFFAGWLGWVAVKRSLPSHLRWVAYIVCSDFMEIGLRTSRQKLSVGVYAEDKSAYSQSVLDALLCCRVFIRASGKDENLTESVEVLHLCGTNVEPLAAVLWSWRLYV